VEERRSLTGELSLAAQMMANHLHIYMHAYIGLSFISGNKAHGKKGKYRQRKTEHIIAYS